MTTALSVVAMLLGLNGCASYTTPGAGVQLTQLADADINELMAKQPAAKFPARIAARQSGALEQLAPGADRGRGDGWCNGLDSAARRLRGDAA